MVHFAILLIIGGFVLIEAPIQHETPVGTLDVAPPSNLPPEEAKPDMTQEPTPPEPDQEQQPNVTQNLQPDAPNVIISPVPNQNYTMVAGTGPILSGVSGALSNGSGSAVAAKGQKSAPLAVGNPFGRSQMLKDGLTGIFYDLKQTANGKPNKSMNDAEYGEVVTEFAKHFNESTLRKYFACPNPLYNTQIFIPFVGADQGPTAFHVEDLVQPRQWVVLYRGSFAAPQTGTYRLVGYGDDVLIVNVDGKVVLDGSINKNNDQDYGPPLTTFKSPEFIKKHKIGGGTAYLAYGYWMDLNAGEAHDIQILIGERPGFVFGTFILVQQKGVDYPLEKNGRPILPIFKLADTDDSQFQNIDNAPAIGTKGPIFALPDAKDESSK